ncbi:MAG: hypothetical protein AAGB11_16195 [Pseudomonadota bacterium]
MSDVANYDEAGQVCHAVGPGDYLRSASETRYSLSLPADSEASALDFLAGVGGGAAGAGRAMRRVGIDGPAVRLRYKQEVEGLARKIAEKLADGQSKETVARWATEERRRIVQRMRAGSGPVAKGIYEIRDWRKYGYGGRTYPNMSRYYRNQGVPQSSIPDKLIQGAQRSNVDVNKAMKGAAYLRHGGRVLIVVGVAISAARIWNASDRDLPRVIGEELGGFIGGGLGAGAGVGICIVFGIATSGWGLLACGVVGGVGGGALGSHVGGSIADGVYYSDATTPQSQMGEVVIEVPMDMVYGEPPANMCYPPTR